MRNNKSQIKMFETIAILVIFFFLVAIGIVFYSQVQKRGIEEDFQQIFDLKSINTVQLANYLPEIQCSTENSLTDNCFDIIKLTSFEEVSSPNIQYYYNLFYYSKITVEQIYPSTETWKIYSKEPVKWREMAKTHLPILLYDPVNKKYNTGVVHIEVYNG